MPSECFSRNCQTANHPTVVRYCWVKHTCPCIWWSYHLAPRTTLCGCTLKGSTQNCIMTHSSNWCSGIPFLSDRKGKGMPEHHFVDSQLWTGNISSGLAFHWNPAIWREHFCISDYPYEACIACIHNDAGSSTKTTDTNNQTRTLIQRSNKWKTGRAYVGQWTSCSRAAALTTFEHTNFGRPLRGCATCLSFRDPAVSRTTNHPRWNS